MSDPHVAPGIPQEEEPKTPMWLPAVGAALFVGVALWWAVTPSGAPSAAAETSASAASSAEAPNPQAQMPRPAQPAAPSPGSQQARIPMPSGLPSALPPGLPAELQKRLNDLRGKQHPQPHP